jgi:hypothetical protein
MWARRDRHALSQRGEGLRGHLWPRVEPISPCRETHAPGPGRPLRRSRPSSSDAPGIYFKDHGRRAQDLQVEFTDVDCIDFEL